MALPTVTPFDVSSDSANVGVRWEKWLNSFKYFNIYYLVAPGICDDARKRALLLHLAGAEVQDIFFTLDDANNGGYDGAVNKLNAHFHRRKISPMKDMCLDKQNKHKESPQAILSID